MVRWFNKSFWMEKAGAFKRFFPLLEELVTRDIAERCHRSALGVLRPVLTPLMLAVAVAVVFSNMFQQNIGDYLIYYLSGALIFSFVAESTTKAMRSVISNAPLIKERDIPKFLFPFSNVLSGLAGLGFSLIAMFIAMAWADAPFHITLLLLPIPIFYAFLFAAGLGMLLSALTVFFRDITRIYGAFILVWFCLTPIFYPADILSPAMMKLMRFNPMYQYASFTRELVLAGEFPGMKKNLLCLLMGLFMILAGLLAFYKKQDAFVPYG